MSTFDEFIAAVKSEVPGFAEEQWTEFKDEAVCDGEAFVQAMQADLRTWTKQLAAGKLTQKDFAWLIKGKKDLAVLNELKRVGLTQAELDRFTRGLASIVVSAAVKTFV